MATNIIHHPFLYKHPEYDKSELRNHIVVNIDDLYIMTMEQWLITLAIAYNKQGSNPKYKKIQVIDQIKKAPKGASYKISYREIKSNIFSKSEAETIHFDIIEELAILDSFV